ncbi:MAG: hypothetical protein U0P30_10570 [Vicinamibacterales bacterium]
MRSRFIAWALAAVPALAVWPAPVAAQDASALTSRYDAAVTALQHRDFGPVERLTRDWGRREFDTAVSRARLDTPTVMQAAALLQLEVAVRTVETSAEDALFHVRLGQRILTPLAKENGAQGDFVARWSAVASSVFLARTDPVRARLAIAFALDHRPNDARVRLTLGAIDDLGSLALDVDDASERLVNRRAAAATRDRARLLAAAEQEYRTAAALAPDLAIARIRLARVLFRRDQPDAARRELDTVRDATLSIGDRYLWLLFSSAVDTALRDIARARTHLEEAVEIAIDRQGSWMALAQLEEREGRPERARAVVEEGLAFRRANVSDEWWEYRNGRFDQEGMTWLRAAVWR